MIKCSKVTGLSIGYTGRSKEIRHVSEKTFHGRRLLERNIRQNDIVWGMLNQSKFKAMCLFNVLWANHAIYAFLGVGRRVHPVDPFSSVMRRPAQSKVVNTTVFINGLVVFNESFGKLLAAVFKYGNHGVFHV
jgi:hypothetical protein